MRPDRDPTRTALPSAFPTVTPELIDAYIRRGRALQAAELWRGLRALGLRLRALARAAGRSREAGASLRRKQAEAVLAEVAGDRGPPLTSIRSSAELLRDHPEIDAAARIRAVESVLAAEARIEAMVAAMVDKARDPERRQLCPG